MQIKIKVEDPPRRKHLVFDGGSVLADLIKTKDEAWILKADYDRDGKEGKLLALWCCCGAVCVTLCRLPRQAWLQMSRIVLLTRSK